MVPSARDPVGRSLGLGRHLDPLLDLASAHGTHLQLQGTVAAEALVLAGLQPHRCTAVKAERARVFPDAAVPQLLHADVPGQYDFVLFGQVGKRVEAGELDAARRKSEWRAAKVELALLERHEACRRKEPRLGIGKHLCVWRKWLPVQVEGDLEGLNIEEGSQDVPWLPAGMTVALA